MTRLLLVCALLVSAGATAAPLPSPMTPVPPLAPLPLETAEPDYAAALAGHSAEQFAAYSRALERSILGEHPGVRMDAVRQLVRYKGRVHAGVATLDVVRLYRDALDPRVRLLALSALHATGDAWAMDFLRRSVPFERDARLRRVMKAIVADYDWPGVVEVEEPFMTGTPDAAGLAAR